MGYVGYFEDILEHYLEQTREMQKFVSDVKKPIEDKEVFIRNLIDEHSRLLEHLLELATNPEKDLVVKVYNLEMKLKTLISEIEKERLKVDAEINDIYSKCEDDKKALLEKIRKLERSDRI